MEKNRKVVCLYNLLIYHCIYSPIKWCPNDKIKTVNLIDNEKDATNE